MNILAIRSLSVYNSHKCRDDFNFTLAVLVNRYSAHRLIAHFEDEIKVTILYLEHLLVLGALDALLFEHLVEGLNKIETLSR